MRIGFAQHDMQTAPNTLAIGGKIDSSSNEGQKLKADASPLYHKGTSHKQPERVQHSIFPLKVIVRAEHSRVLVTRKKEQLYRKLCEIL